MEHEIYNHFLKVKSVTTDSRKIEKDTIYFALKGERFNGNEFALQAIQQGASIAVVDEDIRPWHPQMIRVKNVLNALQQVGLLYRRSLKIPFLAITGSNGKTTTKELVRDVLKKNFRVAATVGNLNNHIGIPLTILSIPENAEFAVIEMGANHQGEISSYCLYAEPDFGLVTNMGKAHLEGFGGEEGVIKGKKELYDYLNKHGGKIFVNTEIEKLKMASDGMDIIPYGLHTGKFHLECISESPTVMYEYQSETLKGQYKTALAGAYNLYNIASAVVIGRFFGIAEKDIHAAITDYLPDNNRSQVKKTAHNTLILDAYNANPTSLEFALKSLASQNTDRKYFIIGDMLELGDSAPSEHRHILTVAQKLGLQGITIGPIFGAMAMEFGFDSFLSNKEAKIYLEKRPLKDYVILIKGSRGIKLEEVIPVL